MRYYEIIREGYKEVQQKYVSAGVDPESVDKTFKTYRDLVNRNQVSGNERNIDWWGKQSFDQFKAFVDEKSSEKSTTQVKRSKLPGKSINLVDNKNWLIVIPLDKDASCFHGKNSAWCTTKPNQSHFEDYFYDKEVILIYCLSKKTGGMWAIATHTRTDQIEMFDQNDRSISKETFNSQTGLDVDKIVAKASTHQPVISSSRDVYKEAASRIKQYLNAGGAGRPMVERNAQVEKDLILTKNGELCVEYLGRVGRKENYPETIQLIAVKQSVSSLNYINYPSEKVQLTAVNKDGLALEFIKNPSEAVQLAAVNQNGSAIRYIQNPSEAVQLATVTQKGWVIRYIKNPSEKVQLAAVITSGLAIDYIKNPSEAVQLAAVTEHGNAIMSIDNPSEKVQWVTIKKHGAYLLKYIDNPSEAVQLAAVSENGSIIKDIKNPSEEVQLAAVTENGDAIYYIVRNGIIPSEQVQLAAVTNFGEAIKYIRKPSRAVKKAAGL